MSRPVGALSGAGGGSGFAERTRLGAQVRGRPRVGGRSLCAGLRGRFGLRLGFGRCLAGTCGLNLGP